MAMVYANRGDCYQLLGSDDKALQDYELCIHELNKMKKVTGHVNEDAYTRVARKCAESLFNCGKLAVNLSAGLWRVNQGVHSFLIVTTGNIWRVFASSHLF